jgi:hypothetical protein
MYLFFLYLFFIWLAAQNLILPWIYRQQLLPASTVGVLMASKEGILVLALLILGRHLWHKDWRLMAADKFALAYTVLLIFYLFWGPSLLGGTAPFALRMISLRSLVSLTLFYFWGRFSFLHLRELRKLIWFIAALQTAVALFGIYEWLFLPTSFWSDTIGAGTFMLDIKGLLEGQNVADGLPSNMFRFGVRRVISSYGDPLAMGIASVFPLLLCVGWLLRRRPRQRAEGGILCWIAVAVIAAALLLTLGRESIGAAGLGVALLIAWSGKAKRAVIPMTIVAAGLICLPQVWNYAAETVTFKEASAATHLLFLRNGWQQIPSMLAGKGLGEAGGWAFSLAGVKSEVGENSYFEVMSQTGILSVALLAGFLFTLGKSALREARAFPDTLVSVALLAGAAHIFARALAATFSPSLFGVVPLASFFFLCGAAFTTLQRTRAESFLVARRVLVLHEAIRSPQSA